jgi:hypothetical protein
MRASDLLSARCERMPYARSSLTKKQRQQYSMGIEIVVGGSSQGKLANSMGLAASCRVEGELSRVWMRREHDGMLQCKTGREMEDQQLSRLS